MSGMRLQKIMVVAVVLALLTAMAAGLSVLKRPDPRTSPTSTMISRFIVVLVFGSFGLGVARQSQQLFEYTGSAYPWIETLLSGGAIRCPDAQLREFLYRLLRLLDPKAIEWNIIDETVGDNSANANDTARVFNLALYREGHAGLEIEVGASRHGEAVDTRVGGQSDE